MKIKGFDKKLCCRGMQYEVGKEYSTDAKNLTSNDLCSDKVLHYCDSLQKVHRYYNCNNNNRYCEIEVLGEEVTDGEIYGSNHIKIIREITGEELEILKGHINGNSGLFNSGDWNIGNHNSGDWNSGYCNSGNHNSGDWNSGDWNSGDCNSGNHNSGVFCDNRDNTVLFFNKESNITWQEWYNHPVYALIYRLTLTKWVDYDDMSDGEKEEHPTSETSGGYLKRYGYKEAWANLWKTLTDAEKSLFKTLPNFDADIFEDITGIRI